MNDSIPNGAFASNKQLQVANEQYGESKIQKIFGKKKMTENTFFWKKKLARDVN